MMEKMKLRRSTLARVGVAAVAVASILGVAACGGYDSEGSSDGGGTVNLVAYSTPETLTTEHHPAFKRRPTARASRSRTRSAPRATRGGRSSPASGRRRPPVARARHAGLVDAGIVAADWTRHIQRHRPELGRGVRGPQGQSEEHPGLGRPRHRRRRGHHAEPVQSGGAQWNLMAAYGAQLNTGQVRGGGARVPKAAAREHARPGRVGERRPGDVHGRQGRRPALLRERGDRGAGGRRGHRLRDPRRHDPDRDPGRASRGRRDPEGSGFPRLPLYRRRRSSCTRTTATARSTRRCWTSDEFPSRPACSRSTVRRLGQGRAEFFDPENGSSPRSSAVWGSPPSERVPATPRAKRRRGPEAVDCRASGAPPLGMGFVDRVPEPDRADPDGGPSWRARSRGRLGRFWTRPAAGDCRAEADADRSPIVSPINVVPGTVIAWVLVRDEFPGKRIVNSLIDLPFALPTIVAGLTLLALYGTTARSGSTPRSPASAL